VDVSKGRIGKIVTVAALIFVLLLFGGCDDDLQPETDEEILVYVWLKDLLGADDFHYALDALGELIFLATQQLPQSIQPLATATSSTRGGDSSSNDRPSLSFSALGGQVKAAAVTSAPSTNAYVLDEVNLYQVDPTTTQVIGTLNLTASPLTGIPVRFALTSDGKSAVITNTNQIGFQTNSPYVLIVDLASLTITANISIPVSALAFGVAITPDNKFAYVVTQSPTTAQNTVYVIDLNNQTVATSIPLPNYTGLTNIVMTPDGTEAYLNSCCGADLKIPVIDTLTNTDAVDVPTYYYSSATGLIYYYVPAYMSMHPDGTRVYLAPMDGEPIRVLNTATKIVTKLITVPQGTAPPGTDPVFTPDGRFLFVLDGPGSIAVINTQSDTLASTVPLNSTVANTPPGGVKVGILVAPHN
jgi:WD40 repeat protein